MTKRHRLLFRHSPPGVSAWDPPTLIASLGGIGYIRFAAGTWGSFAALFPALLVADVAGGWVLPLLAAILIPIGRWATVHIQRSGEKDSSVVVIDELIGQWIALAPALIDWRSYLLAFLAFRVFDILKPWPACVFDRRSGPGDVIYDDVIAGVYAAIVVAAGQPLLGISGS